MKKVSLIAAAVTSALCSYSAMACTTILVGDRAMADGSYIVARNEDYQATNAKHFVLHPATKGDTSTFRSHGNDFSYPNPKNGLQYTSLSDFNTNNQSMGEAGFNSAGVGMSSTETIYNGAKALKADPYVTKTGINEDSIENVILPRIHTAKEGVELLGKIIETQGAAEGFGVAFVDNHGIWYLETGSGHQWMAQKIPNNKYFVSANQGRLQRYIPNNADYLASPTLISFAEQHHLGRANKDGSFDFHLAYSQDVKNDLTYNYPRVWTVQHLFTKGLDTNITQGKDFPLFLKPTTKLTLTDIETALQNHYQGTKHDPYTNQNPQEAYRPISVFRTQESHILQVRPHLPRAIGEVEYVSWGMSALGVYLPFYQGMTKVPAGYDIGTDHADNQSANWKFRKLQTLAMTDWNKYAPVVQKAYREFEQQTAVAQQKMEKQYLATYQQHPLTAEQIINSFEQQTSDKALALTEKLTNDIFTQMTHATDMTYHFEGA